MRRKITGGIVALVVALLTLAAVPATAYSPTPNPHVKTVLTDTGGVVETDVIDWAPGATAPASEDEGPFAPYRFGKYGFPDTTICLEERLNGIPQYQEAIASAADQLNALPDILAWDRPSGGCASVPDTRKIIYTFYSGGADGRCAYNHIVYDSATHVVLSSNVRINTYYYSACQNTWQNRYHVELHEAVHAFGLNHTTATSVMHVTVWIPFLSDAWDRPHLNQLYHD